MGAWPCGQQAALALSDWIGQQTVTCESTKKEANELYKHWLARCAVAGQDVAEWLAANGWAVPYRDCKCDTTRNAAQDKSRTTWDLDKRLHPAVGMAESH